MDVLSQYLSKNQLTQADFAGKIGLSASALSLILSGARRPGIAVTKKIEQVTGIPRHALRPDVYEAAQ